jgi:hypothetical protein
MTSVTDLYYKVHHGTTLVSQTATINTPATNASILGAPLNARAKHVPITTRRARGDTQSAEKETLKSTSANRARIVQPNRLRNVTAIEAERIDGKRTEP